LAQAICFSQTVLRQVDTRRLLCFHVHQAALYRRLSQLQHIMLGPLSTSTLFMLTCVAGLDLANITTPPCRDWEFFCSSDGFCCPGRRCHKQLGASMGTCGNIDSAKDSKVDTEANVTTPPCRDWEFFCSSDGACCPGRRCHKQLGASMGTCGNIDSAQDSKVDSEANVTTPPCRDWEFFCSSDGACCPGRRCHKQWGASMGTCGNIDSAQDSKVDTEANVTTPPCRDWEFFCSSDGACCPGRRCHKQWGASMGTCGNIDTELVQMASADTSSGVLVV
jgi:hypothetical protein